MITLIIIFLTLLQQTSSVDLAEQAYNSGDYQTAIGIYEGLVANGVNDSAIYYNLGNAHYEAGQLGYAMVNYLRAQRLAARDEQINRNIGLVRAERVDFQGDEEDIIHWLASSTYSTMTRTELTTGVLIIWILWFGLAVMWMLWQKHREVLRQGLIVVGVGLIIGLSLLLPRLYTDSQRPVAIVVDLSTSVMSGPGEDYIEIYELFAATEMRLIEHKNGWVRFILPDSRQGWISQDAIDAV